MHKLNLKPGMLSSVVICLLACGNPDRQNPGGECGVACGVGSGVGGDPGGGDESGTAAYLLVDTGQERCYDQIGTPIDCPEAGAALHGQDAQYGAEPASYTNNGDGTITDNRTGMMWQRDPGAKMSWNDAMSSASNLDLGGYTDWRVPSIKELYSLINFSGITGISAVDSTPYLDTAYFVFQYGDVDEGERLIDAQYWSSTEYLSTTMNNDETIFGVNFADGRIKGYPKSDPRIGAPKRNFVLFVRDASGYGRNDFIGEGGVVEDRATGLAWMQVDSGAPEYSDTDAAMNWEQALAWCEQLDYAGFSDWRLPNAKELHSIVDYSRSPDTTGSAAIDPIFEVTPIIDGNGQPNFPFFWTSTTHLDGPDRGGTAVYIAFGEALGFMEMPPGSGNLVLLDVHGAGAQRSDPKIGNPDDFPEGRGPQGDVIRIFNHVRCARTAAP